MKKIFNIFLTILLSIITCLLTVSCTSVEEDNNNADNTGEETVCNHNYSEYYYNGEQHYKRATCNCYNVPFSSVGNHDMVNDKCSVCDYRISSGLEFALNSNGSSYTLVGRGSCTDEIIGVPNTYEDFPVSAIKGSAFSGDSKLKGIVLPLGITNIPGSVFADCINLKMISIPEGVKELGSSCFKSTAIKYIDLPSTITKLGHGSFYMCEHLKEIVVPDKCETITKGCFSGCRDLEKVVFGEKVKFIGVRAFQNCYRIKEIHIKSVANWAKINFNNSTSDNENDFNVNPLTLNEINSSAKVFVDGKLLEELVIPEGVTVIGKQTFSNINTVKKLVLPASLTEISIFAFMGFTSLKEIEFKGTIAEWEAVTKKPAWITMHKTNVVKCADGDVKL